MLLTWSLTLSETGGCGSFYAIQLSSKEFKGMSTVKAHRLVNQELKDVIKDIHGLQVRSREGRRWSRQWGWC